MTRIEFENSVMQLAMESGLKVGVITKSLAAVQWRISQAKDRLAGDADIHQAAEYGKLFIDPDGRAPALL